MKVLCEQENNSPGIKFKKQYTRRHEAKLLLYTKVHHDTNKWLKKTILIIYLTEVYYLEYIKKNNNNVKKPDYPL